MKKNNPFSRGIKQKKRRIVEVEQIEQEEEQDYENEQNDNGIELVESDETDVQILPSVPRKNFEDQFPKIEKAPEKVIRWPDIGCCKWMTQTCEAMGLKYPTPIQENCIPPLLKNRDAICSAPTGSGKTAAFAIPILQRLSEDPYGIYALILTPTRELAFQIAEQFTSLGAPMSVKVEVVIGGKDPVAQSLSLAKKPHIVISTPGRLVDHLEMNSGVDLSRLKFLVLDEADRLLSGESLRSCLETILEYCPPPERRQTLLFSATMTMNESLLNMMHLKDPFTFSVGPKYNTVETLRQEYMLVPAKVKDCNLVYLLRCEETDPDETDEEGNPLEMISIIVFVSTCKSAQLVNDTLRELGIKCVSLHSALPQNKRLANLMAFRSGHAKVLIATDVASRGLDIPTVELVINYDLPKEAEDYIHRVGRTARANRGGRALTFVTQFDVNKVLAIEDKIGKKLSEFGVEEQEVLRHLNETTIAKTKAEMKLEKDELYLRKNKRRQEAKEAKKAKLQQ